METFATLFGSVLAFVYHCFDRIVILGHIPLLTRPENIVHFFRDLHQSGPITKDVLRKRTNEYNRWVDAFAAQRRIPVEWAEHGVRKEDYVRRHLRRIEQQNRFGVYFILKSMEVGPTFRSSVPRYPTADPDYRIISRQRCRYTHSYFYIRDPVLGPLSMCVGSFLPFQISYYLNGHHFIERELIRKQIGFRKDDNAFLAVDDPSALPAAADRLSADIIRKRLDYWTWLVGPKFSSKDREAIHLSRHYSIQQVEYCRNLIFRRHFPIHKLFERSCDIGLLRMWPDKITQIFGFRVHKRLRGKLQSMLEKVEHGHHVFRACGQSAVLRMYEKFAMFLRLEALSNNLRDFGLRKSLDNLDAVRKTLTAVTDRFAAFEAEALNVHVDFPLFQHLALPVAVGTIRVPGLKIHDTRMIRLMEVLLHSGTKITGWRTAEVHQAILTSFDLKPTTYTLNQLRYDIRKMKAHGLIERCGKRYAYRLTDKGNKVALLFILFHKRVCGPLANSLFQGAPSSTTPPTMKLGAAYRKADQSIHQILQLLAA
ncbi:MAG TPA: hypothetical protein VM715_14660 [Candidatus Acidoferrum sp.]|nr:hypothetical protein [Candidatus Acidoferrum sp.]